MAIYTRGVPVRVIVDGDEEMLTREMIAEDVLVAAGGVEAVRGPVGPRGETGPQGEQGETGAIGPGVPAGGTTGQMLTKASATDGHTAWATIPLGHVRHDAVAATRRPTGYAVVIWVGSVEPTYKQAGDLWVRTA